VSMASRFTRRTDLPLELPPRPSRS